MLYQDDIDKVKQTVKDFYLEREKTAEDTRNAFLSRIDKRVAELEGKFSKIDKRLSEIDVKIATMIVKTEESVKKSSKKGATNDEL